MNNKMIIGIASGLAIASLAYIFRNRIRSLFEAEEEESFFDGRSTYRINELMPDDNNPFDKIREKISKN